MFSVYAEDVIRFSRLCSAEFARINTQMSVFSKRIATDLASDRLHVVVGHVLFPVVLPVCLRPTS